MTIGILKEPDFENRVSLLPEAVKALINLKASVIVERGAGVRAFTNDELYTEAGANISDRQSVIKQADLLLSIHAPDKETLGGLKKGQVVISVFNPLADKNIVTTKQLHQ